MSFALEAENTYRKNLGIQLSYHNHNFEFEPKEGVTVPFFGSPMPADAFQPLGAGTIPMEPIIVAAKAAGVGHCHVEQDQSPAPLTDIGTSMAYLRKL